MTSLSVEAEDGETVIFGHNVSDLQSDLKVGANAISGTLKYVDSGALARDWGAGYFMALKFDDIDPTATSVKVGLVPSKSSGLVELIGDPDMNGVFKVTDPRRQSFVVISSNDEHSTTQEFDLRGLKMEKSE